MDNGLYGRDSGKLLHAAVVYRPSRTGQRVIVRLLSTDGRQQHIERRRVDTFRDDRSRLLSQCLATGAGTCQFGTLRRVVEKPGAAAQQPERRLYLHHRLLAERLHHQPWRQTDKEGIRLRNPCEEKLEPGGNHLRGGVRFLFDGPKHVQGATQCPSLGVQRQRGGLYLLYSFRRTELLSGNGRREAAGLRERDHQRNLLGRGYARSGHDTVQVPNVRQISRCAFKGVRHADHGHGERTGLVRAGRHAAGGGKPGSRPSVANQCVGKRECRPTEKNRRGERGRCGGVPTAVQCEQNTDRPPEKRAVRMAEETAGIYRRKNRGGGR